MNLFQVGEGLMISSLIVETAPVTHIRRRPFSPYNIFIDFAKTKKKHMHHRVGERSLNARGFGFGSRRKHHALRKL
jgi:hypothetical protein